MTRQLPIVGFACDWRQLGAHAFHMVGEKYITAVRDGANAVPVLLPVLEPPIAPEHILESVDGLLFTGSPSNIAPHHYGGENPRDGVLQDEHRDDTALPLLKAAIAQGTPVLCICRGFQELNVALGGTLHQHVNEVQGRSDHRETKGVPIEEQYGPSHRVSVRSGGLLSNITAAKEFLVNSLHSQGIDVLSAVLHADAVAPDGQIEAASMPGAKGFVLGLQWHPEWAWSENPVSRAIFSAFGQALRTRRSKPG